MRKSEGLRQKAVQQARSDRYVLRWKGAPGDVGHAECRSDCQENLKGDDCRRTSQRIEKRVDAIVPDIALLHQAGEEGRRVVARSEQIADGVKSLCGAVCSK